MATTVDAIATAAFAAVASKITDAVQSCTLTRTTQGVYDPSTGSYATTTTAYTGRAVEDTATAIADNFPAYVVGPSDRLFWLEGLTVAPVENDALTVGAEALTVKQTGNVVGAGGLYAVVAA